MQTDKIAAQEELNDLFRNSLAYLKKGIHKIVDMNCFNSAEGLKMLLESAQLLEVVIQVGEENLIKLRRGGKK